MAPCMESCSWPHEGSTLPKHHGRGPSTIIPYLEPNRRLVRIGANRCWQIPPKEGKLEAKFPRVLHAIEPTRQGSEAVSAGDSDYERTLSHAAHHSKQQPWPIAKNEDTSSDSWTDSFRHVVRLSSCLAGACLIGKCNRAVWEQDVVGTRSAVGIHIADLDSSPLLRRAQEARFNSMSQKGCAYGTSKHGMLC
jgi:hypothetical protein